MHVISLAGGLCGCQNNLVERSQFDNNTGQPMWPSKGPPVVDLRSHPVAIISAFSGMISYATAPQAHSM